MRRRTRDGVVGGAPDTRMGSAGLWALPGLNTKLYSGVTEQNT